MGKNARKDDAVTPHPSSLMGPPAMPTRRHDCRKVAARPGRQPPKRRYEAARAPIPKASATAEEQHGRRGAHDPDPP
jgi:hypothetical protein